MFIPHWKALQKASSNIKINKKRGLKPRIYSSLATYKFVQQMPCGKYIPKHAEGFEPIFPEGNYHVYAARVRVRRSDFLVKTYEFERQSRSIL